MESVLFPESRRAVMLGVLLMSILPITHPTGGIVSADNSTLYISNFDANSIGVFSVDEAQLVGSARAGDGPDALAFSTSGHLLFAVDHRSGDVAVIRTLTHSLFTMLPTGSQPNDIVVKSFYVR